MAEPGPTAVPPTRYRCALNPVWPPQTISGHRQPANLASATLAAKKLHGPNSTPGIISLAGRCRLYEVTPPPTSTAAGRRTGARPADQDEELRRALTPQRVGQEARRVGRNGHTKMTRSRRTVPLEHGPTIGAVRMPNPN